MRPYTLIVIDMQPYFITSCCEGLKKAITNQIILAKKNNLPIIFLEYNNCGEVHDELTRHIQTYKNFHRVIKDEDDGSSELEMYWKKRSKTRIFYRNLVVCGVNTDACVYRTVYGLLSPECPIPISKVTIPVNCCNNGNYHSSISEVEYHKYNPFHYLYNLAKVELV